MKLYNQIYGSLSVGAGSWMNKNIFSKFSKKISIKIGIEIKFVGTL